MPPKPALTPTRRRRAIEKLRRAARDANAVLSILESDPTMTYSAAAQRTRAAARELDGAIDWMLVIGARADNPRSPSR